MFYLVSGDLEGCLSIFEIGKPGRERFVKQIASYQGRPGIRFICWREKNREIISGSHCGKVTVWSVKTSEPLYVLDAH
jgi:hypothetical protein